MLLQGLILKQAISATGSPQNDPVISSVWPAINTVYRGLASILLVLLIYSLVRSFTTGSERSIS